MDLLWGQQFVIDFHKVHHSLPDFNIAGIPVPIKPQPQPAAAQKAQTA